MSNLTALPWSGSKSAATTGNGAGKYIAKLLPYDPHGVYCEPFAGMLGQLLGRPRSKVELVNDLDKCIINWWTVLRERPEELVRAINFTPNSREEEWLCREDAGDDLERARRFTVRCSQKIMGSDTSSWTCSLNPAGFQPWATLLGKCDDGRLYRIANRMRYVHLECRDALEVCERVIAEPRALVYVDPPYPSAGYRMYKHADDVDHSELERLLIDAKAKVALSGYPADHPDLHEHPNWYRFDMYAVVTATVHQNIDRNRVECLWTNYDPRAS